MVISVTMETVVPYGPCDFWLAYFLQLWTHTYTIGHALTVKELDDWPNEFYRFSKGRRVSWLSIFWSYMPQWSPV